ncbi:MAG: 50S ribosomal protein L4 [Candidatus Altiarchaeota archaeon]
MASVYSIDGKHEGSVELPGVFKTEYRPDLIQRAVVSLQAGRRQVYGTDPYAGLRTSADYYGNRKHTYRQTINKGMSRLPREKPGGGGLGKVRRVPNSVGGMNIHGPRKKDYTTKINKKEYAYALHSAIAATADKEIVSKRGHNIEGVSELPLVIEDAFETVKKTKDVLMTLQKLGLEGDLARASIKKINPGKGKSRGRKYNKRKSLLIILNEDRGVKKAAENIPGVEAVTVKELNVELLAPGTHAGRLTLWTKSAIQNIEK